MRSGRRMDLRAERTWHIETKRWWKWSGLIRKIGAGVAALEDRMQTSESFRLSAILSFSGGLQDAYTYNTRGSVFANAQTGNVVLMSQNLMMGNWKNGMLYVSCP